MNIVVCIKQVVDVTFPFALDQNSFLPLEEDTFHKVNPADRGAVEMALSLQERFGGTVTFVSFGPPRVEKALKSCLAMGGDRAVRVWEDGVAPHSQAKAYLLAQAVASLSPDLVLCGNRSLDEGSGETPGAMAEFLGYPQVTGLTDLEVTADRKGVAVKRKLERGRREEIQCPLPAVLALEEGVLQPRYANLPRLLDSSLARVDCVKGETVGCESFEVRKLSSLRNQVRRALPRPRPKKTFNLDSGLTAEQRMELMMSGGGRQAKSDMLEGPAKDVAGKLAEILKEKVVRPV